MVCRRGDVKSSAVGAIQIGDFQSVVEVDVARAADFAKAAERPDARNPRIKIRPWVDKKPAKGSRQGFRSKGGGFASKGKNSAKGGFRKGFGPRAKAGKNFKKSRAGS
jgi:hypothetical protein